MRTRSLLPIIVIALTITGCARMNVPSDQAQMVLEDLPASFSGEIPCADCPGIVYQLNLFEDGTFYESMTYLERDAIFYDIGRWSHRLNTSVIELHGGGDQPSYIGVIDTESIEMLDIEGQPIESSLNYTLHRSPDFERIEPRLTMSGMYQYMADAALFTECRTGARFPVSMEADNIALESAYLDVRDEPGEQVLVTLEGSIALRPAMEGDALVPKIIPERFVSVSPGATCESVDDASDGTTSAAIENIHWNLVALNGDVASSGIEGRAPSLSLDSFAKHASGATGCNVFGGSYTLIGDELNFGELVSTRMYCEGVMDQESAYLDALESTRAWRLNDGGLELIGGDGGILARFEAQ